MSSGAPQSLSAFELARDGWRLMNQRRELWALPVLATGFGMLIWAISLYFLMEHWIRNGPMTWLNLLLLPTWFVSACGYTYFQAVLAKSLLEENDSDAMDNGMGAAWQYKSQIAAWTLINGSAHAVLGALKREARWLPGLGWLGGMAWGTATFLVIPFIIQGKGVGQAMRLSTEVVKEQWMESILGLGSLWIIFRSIQGVIGAIGTVFIWMCVMANQPVAGVAVGFLTGVVVLAISAVRQAMAIAFAVQFIKD